jgi:phosphoribosylanthranilate isomerase
MALKTLVKVGCITNLSDARYCAGMGVDFLGFRVINGQSGTIPVKSFQEIRGWITGPQIVAEIYGIDSTDELRSVMQDFQPDYVELSLNELNKIGSAITIPYILSLKHGEELPSSISSRPAYILTDLKVNPSTSKYIPDFELLVQVSRVDDLSLAVGQTGISGIALLGGSEIRPGLKEYEELSAILEALEED